jgi:hypothetical protein
MELLAGTVTKHCPAALVLIGLRLDAFVAPGSAARRAISDVDKFASVYYL